jgi:hypothetical protein
MGAVAIAAPATNSPHCARCAFQKGYLCPRGCEAPWVTVEHPARQKRASGRRRGELVRQAHDERQGDIKSRDVLVVEMANMPSDSFGPDRDRLVGHHLRSHS